MRRLLCALGFACILPAIPSAALDLSAVPPIENKMLEARRARVDSLVGSGLWEEALAEAGRLLESRPRDGFAVRAVVTVAWKSGRLDPLRSALEADETPPWPGAVRLAPVERDLALGLIAYYVDRYRTAESLFSRVVEEAPDWSWPRLYRARCRWGTLAPQAEWEPDLQIALGDPDTAPAALNILTLSRPEGSLGTERAAARAVLDSIAVPIWARRDLASNRAFEAVLDSGMTAERALATWRECRDPLGSAVLDEISALGSRIVDLMPPEEAERLCREEGRTPLESAAWSRVWADCLGKQMRRRESLAVLRALRPTFGAMPEREFALRSADDPPDTLLALAREALAKGVGSWNLSQLERLRTFTSNAAWDSLLVLARREDPAAALEAGLGDRMETDIESCLAAVDSLESSGADPSLLSFTRALVREYAGDVEAADAILEAQPAAVEAGWRRPAADAALARGDDARARRHIERALSLDPENLYLLIDCLRVVTRMRDAELATSLTDRLIERCPSCAFAAPDAVRALAASGQAERALRALRWGASAPHLPAATTSDLAVLAAGLGEADLGDSLLARAAAEDPGSRTVRFCLASTLAQQRRLDAAREIAQELVRQFPGNESYRRLLLQAGGQVQVANGAEPAGDDPFEPLGQDLASVDWILEAAAAADTLRDEDAVCLERRQSLLADRRDQALLRTRTVMLLLTEEGVERYQPLEIYFSASDPAPEIRVARVIRRDGSIVDVPRTDILVTAPQDEDVDVGESRCLAIPFAGLEPGSVLDLVYDRVLNDAGTNGWSTRLLLQDASLVLRSQVDFLRAADLPVTVRVPEGLAPSREERIGSRIVSTWELADLPSIDWDILSPNLFESFRWFGFSSYPSWEFALQEVQREYWDRIHPETLREEAAAITGDRGSEREKLEAIYRHVVDSIRYLAIELDRGRFLPATPEDVLSRGYGDCKDMAALLTALLRTAGIDAEPVLVSSRSNRQPLEELPEPFLFDHVVVLAHADGEIYCDPTTGSRCLGAVPPGIAGVRGIVLPPSGPMRWRRLPEASPEEHGFDLVADLVPRDDGRASLEVRATYRGVLADGLREVIAEDDSAGAASVIEGKLGYGIWETCRLTGWRQVADDCSGLVLQASLEDTAWAEQGQNSIQFRWATEVADPVFFYPPAEERTLDAVLPFPFHDTAVLRLHRTPTWRTEPKLAAVRVSGDAYEGGIEVGQGVEGEDGWVEVREDFTLRRGRLSRDEYRSFRDDWIRFLVGVHQPYGYYRLLADQDLRQIEEYLAKHPEDTGFALEAAGRVLGGDLGGEGPSGQARRAAARRWLLRAASAPDAGPFPAVILAGIESEEGRYRKADSVLAAAAKVDPGDFYLLSAIIRTKRELGQFDDQIEAMRALMKRGSSASLQLSLITALYRTGRDAEAQEAEQRFFLLQGGADSTRVLLARFSGQSAAGRTEEAGRTLEALRGRVSEDLLSLLEQEFCTRAGRYEQSREILERLWEDDPLNAVICNNLAWVYAILGERLDHAEELAESAVILSSDPSGSRNTLGAIYARRGDWRKAEKTFREALAADDRPSHQAANQFFLGLCEYQLGRREAAVSRWRAAQKIEADPESSRWIRRALELQERGKPVTGAIFVESGPGGP